MNFESLVGRINQVQDALQAQAAHAVNLSLTARNWLVGYYIVEFEQQGEDRAKYGDKLLKQLAQNLNRRGLGERRLYEYRLTYLVYPQLGTAIVEYIVNNRQEEILRLPTAKSIDTTSVIEKLRSSTAISKASQEEWHTPVKSLFYKLSATHLVYLSNITDDLKIDRFHHEYASQLNLYLNYFRHEVMQEDDNPPIGLLLCTDYGETTVQYATEGLSQNLFVSKYRLQLPSEEEIRSYLIKSLTEDDFKETMETNGD